MFPSSCLRQHFVFPKSNTIFLREANYLSKSEKLETADFLSAETSLIFYEYIYTDGQADKLRNHMLDRLRFKLCPVCENPF